MKFLKFFNQKGFSMLQAVMLAGAIGGVSLVVMKQSQETNKQIRTNQTELAVDELANQIQANLLSRAICTSTFLGLTVIDGGLGSVNFIKSAEGARLFEVNKNYLNNQVALSWIQLRRTGSDAIVSYEVRKVGNENNRGLGGKAARREVRLKAEWDGGNRLTSCYSDIGASVDEAVDTVINKLCRNGSNGLFYSPTLGACETVPQLETGIFAGEFVPETASLICPDGQALSGITFNAGTGRFKKECKTILTFSGVCNDYDLVRRKPDGSFVCSTAKCPVGSFFNGFTGLGVPICITCDAGSTIVKTSSGVACKGTSCDPGTKFLGYDSNGDILCSRFALKENDSSNPDPFCLTGGKLVFEDNRLVLKCVAPDCSDSVNHCNGTYYSNASGMCTGTKVGNCSAAANYCAGTSFPDSAGCTACTGTKVMKDGLWSAPAATGNKRIKSGAVCTAGSIQMEAEYIKTCFPPECGGAPCMGDATSWMDSGTETCSPAATCDSFNSIPNYLHSHYCYEPILPASDWYSVSAECECQDTQQMQFLNCIPANGTNNGIVETQCRSKTDPPTPVNGGWSAWVNGTCSGGTMTKTRTCNNPLPSNGGANCTGLSSMSEACGGVCTLNGEFCNTGIGLGGYCYECCNAPTNNFATNCCWPTGWGPIMRCGEEGISGITDGTGTISACFPPNYDNSYECAW